MRAPIALTFEQMAQWERDAIAETGQSPNALMAAAGNAVATHIVEQYRPRRAVVLCGFGKNGGDGIVCAAALRNEGVGVRCAHVAPPRDNANILQWPATLWGFPLEVLSGDELRAVCESADIVVDALLGIGTAGPIRPSVMEVVTILNEVTTPKVAVDVPTGLSETSVTQSHDTVRCDMTVTFGFAKRAFLEWPGCHAAGEIIVEPLAFPSPATPPQESQNPLSQLHWASPEYLKNTLRPRSHGGHKGHFGHVAIVGACPAYSGATILAARAAARSGAGLITIVTTPNENVIYKIAVPQAITKIIPSNRRGDELTNYGREDVPAILDAAKFSDAVVLGPGLGLSDETPDFVEALIKQCDKPLLLDADALTALAGLPSYTNLLSQRTAPTILTPHPGEFSRLTGQSPDVQVNQRPELAAALARETNAIIVLKGPSTVVASPDGHAILIPGATSALARGGTGDILAGILGTLLAQDYPAAEAATLAVAVHLKSGQIVERRIGARGANTNDIIKTLPAAWREIESGMPRTMRRTHVDTLSNSDSNFPVV